MLKITVVTVVLKDWRGLKKTVSSVTNQSQSNYQLEYIVIDGMSLCEKIDDVVSNSKIDKYLSEKDSGIYDAMNKGIKLATGDWVIFLNAGDTFYSSETLDRMSSHLSLADSAQDNFIYGNYITESKRVSQNLSIRYLASHMINHQSIFYKRDLLTNSNFDIRYKYCADYKHLLDNLNRLNSKYIDENICFFDSDGVSSDENNRLIMWIERLRSIWESELKLTTKLMLSSRGCMALPYHYIKSILKGVEWKK
ncbi:glycosyltransferase [Vibrio breoganii]